MPDWPFARGDVWLLRYHPGEIDDGVAAIGPPYAANIGAWVNGESIRNQDVVVWYAAHFTHDVHETGAHHGHVVGPDSEAGALVGVDRDGEAEKEGFEPSMEAFTPITP